MSEVWSHPGYDAVARLLAARTGLVFSPNRFADAEAGIKRAMARAPSDDPLEYLGKLEEGTADFADLVAELTVGETYFFRQPQQFDFIRNEALPALVNTRPADHVMRLWSAGCASGEEAYSLSMVLAEVGLGDRGEILATDISPVALAKARAAAYGPWALRDVSHALIRRHFYMQEGRQVVKEDIRARVRLEFLNLARDAYPSFGNGTWRMDLILCRNVLIYFDSTTVSEVTRRLCECLAPGGWLVTSASDPPVDHGGLCETITTAGGLVYRRQEVAPFEEVAPAPVIAPAVESPLPIVLAPPPSPSSPKSSPPPDLLAEAERAFARGQYERAAELATGMPDVASAVLCIRATANSREPAVAERVAAQAMRRFPQAPEIHFLRAVLLVELNRAADAVEAARRVLYLDGQLAMGHFVLGTALERLGDRAGAARAFRNAHASCARLPADQVIPMSDGQRADQLAEAAAGQVARLAMGAA